MVFKKEFDALADRLKAASYRKKVVYVPNPGNFGDGLIRYGTKAFFSDYQIDHTEINIAYRGGRIALAPHLLRRNDHFFVFGGGGAWCKAHSRGRRMVSFLTRFTPHVMVLPSSYQLPPLRSAGIYFRRDECQSKDLVPNSYFCHDMAFYLADRGVPYRATIDGPEGNLFRTDTESRFSVAELPRDNADLSTLGNHMSNADELLKVLSKYSAVRTDRLHLAIGALLVGCKVELYSGNYFKIGSIYKSSMAAGFKDQVRLISDAPLNLNSEI